MTTAQLILIGIAFTGIVAGLVAAIVCARQNAKEDGPDELAHGDCFPVDFIPRDPVRRARNLTPLERK